MTMPPGTTKTKLTDGFYLVEFVEVLKYEGRLTKYDLTFSLRLVKCPFIRLLLSFPQYVFLVHLCGQPFALLEKALRLLQD